ncbi:MAG TPA: vitamin K epoxide reductase family protein [Thermoplasmata archaeon]|nr:vitamin K epoxide reductase family protein [Thermoplasmata archaeon]
MRAETLHQILLAAILAGLGLALYAGIEVYYALAASVCSPSPIISCSAVLKSGKTTIFGVQDWIIGTAGFVALLIVDVLVYRTWKRSYLAVLLGLSTIGLGVSAYLAAVEVTQIGALCPVCFASYVANAVALAMAVTIWRRGAADRSGSVDRVDEAATGPTGSA